MVQRLLGDPDFVGTVLKQAGENYERGYGLEKQGIGLEYTAGKAARIYEITPEEIFSGGRQKKRADARGLLCYRANRELKIPLTDLARRLNMTPSGVGSEGRINSPTP